MKAALCALLLAAPLVAQDAAPSPADRVPIEGVVETWMRFVQRGEHRGYTHERISLATARQYRYEYLFEGDLDLAAAGDAPDEQQIVRWTWHLTAQLTENFNPYRLDLAADLAVRRGRSKRARRTTSTKWRCGCRPPPTRRTARSAAS